MRIHLLAAALLMGAAVPTSARATCMDEVIAGCDRAIPGSNPISLTLRGYCYLLGSANCVVQL
jgi:hypothetical protein